MERLAKTAVYLIPIAILVCPLSSYANRLQYLSTLAAQQQKQINYQKKELNALKTEIKTIQRTLPSPASSDELPPPADTKIQIKELSGIKKAKIKIYGTVNQLVMAGDDGFNPQVFFATNDAYITRLTVEPYIQIKPGLRVGSIIQLGFEINSTDQISQTNPNVDDGIDMRKVEIYVKSDTWGELYIGKGNTAARKTPRQDISGTRIILQSRVQKVGGGLIFRSSDTDNFTGPRVRDVFNALDGRRNTQVRYNTPKFHGFYVAASASEGKTNDVALWYKDTLGKTKVAGSAGYISTRDFRSSTGALIASGNIIVGSVSVLFPTGISITTASGTVINNRELSDKPKYYFFKLGLLRRYFNVGKTAISLDFGRYDDFDRRFDRGKAYGATFVQNINPWNLQIYALFQRFQLIRAITYFHPINVYALGASFKF